MTSPAAAATAPACASSRSRATAPARPGSEAAREHPRLASRRADKRPRRAGPLHDHSRGARDLRPAHPRRRAPGRRPRPGARSPLSDRARAHQHGRARGDRRRLSRSGRPLGRDPRQRTLLPGRPDRRGAAAMSERHNPDPAERVELTEQDLAIATLVGRYIESREQGAAPRVHDLLSVADELRAVLAFYEAMRTTENDARWRADPPPDGGTP